jgi:lipopolysaccharide export system permease protein
MGLKDFRSELSRLSKDRKGEAYRALLLEYHKKWALPTASLVFGLLGAPIGAMIRSTSKFAGFASGVLIVILYYLLFAAAEFLNGSGILPGSAAAWLPNAFMTLVMAALVWKIGRR